MKVGALCLKKEGVHFLTSSLKKTSDYADFNLLFTNKPFSPFVLRLFPIFIAPLRQRPRTSLILFRSLLMLIPNESSKIFVATALQVADTFFY